MEIPTGRFVWFDYVTHDAKKAQAFFGSLFGWTTQTLAMFRGHYTTIVSGDRQLGGYMATLPDTPMFRFSEPIARWLPYLQIANAHDSAVKLKTLGGTMIREPYAVADAGKMAIAADPHGERFALWQPAAVPDDHGWAGPPGTFCWAELYTSSPSSSVRVLKQLGGFTETKSAMGDGTYHLLERDGAPRAGVRQPMPGMPPGWFAWVRVADVDATVAKAKQLGAEINVPPADMGASRMALITDPFGAALGIMRA